MNKFKNIFRDKFLDFKRFLTDNRKTSAFLSLLLFSFGAFFIVFAEGEVTYSVTDITSSIVVSENTDVKKNNNSYVVPNLGTIQYEIGYKLSSNSEEIASGPVVIDIFLPAEYNAKVMAGANILSPSKDTQNNNEYIKIGNKNYFHYISNETKPINDEANVSLISFSSLNDKNNIGTFSPIISVRNDSNEFNLSKVNNVLGSDINLVTVNSSLNYQLKSYLGNAVKQDNGKYIVPIGVMAYIPVENIKGAKLPTSLSYNLTLYNSSFNLLTNENKVYTESSNYTINGLPYSKPCNVALAPNSSNITVNVSDINPSVNDTYNSTDTEINPESIVISSNYFLYETTLEGLSELTFNFVLSSSSPPLYNSENYTIYFTETVGKFESHVHFEDNNGSTAFESMPIKNVTYGKDFNFFVTSEYATATNEQADALNEITTYVKLDENITNLKINSVQIKTGNEEYSEMQNYNVKYYSLGWNKQNFTFNGVSNNLNKNQIMNLFGGPSISSKSLVEKSNSTDDGVTVIQFVSNSKVPAGSKIKISFTGTIKDDANLIKEENKNIQIVSLSKTRVRLNSNSSEQTEFYLGEQKENGKYVSSISFASSPNNYSLIQNAYDGKNGNTISVSAGSPGNIESETYASIETVDVNTSKNIKILHNQTEFYSGVDDPFIWRIYSNESLGSQSSITEVTQKITIPKTDGYEYLEFNNAFLVDKDSLFSDALNNTDSSDYTNDSIRCLLNSNENGCSYTVEKTTEGISYIFKIFNTNLNSNIINSYLKNGLFFETKIDLIANSSVVPLKVSTSHKYNTIFSKTTNDALDTESSIINSDINAQIYNLKSPIANSGSLSLTSDGNNRTMNLQAEKNFPYYFYMNSVISNKDADDLELYYVLPHNTETENNFNGTYQIKLPSLPEGYSAYYLSSSLENIDYDITTISNRNSDEWQTLSANQLLNNTDVVALKIVKNDKTSLNTSYYFGGSKNSILIEITPTQNEYKNKYINTFYIKSGSTMYDAKDSIFSTFNRTIKGLAFEDYDFDGFYSINEDILKDLPTELYKVNLEEGAELDVDNPSNYIDKSTLVGETIYSTDKGYSFEKLEAGLYFLKIKFDSEYYNITDYDKEDHSMGSENISNSKFKLDENGTALSKVIVLGDNDNLNIDNINLGLAIKKAFAVDINKYIKSIKVIKNGQSEEYNYDKEKQVKLDFKDLNNTSFEVTYGFDIKNTKYYPGYVGQIVEAIPAEMIFDEAENAGWVKSEDYLYYTALQDTLIMPEETYTFEIKLKIPENTAGDFINIISVGDLRILETSDSVTNSSLEDTISTLGEEK